MSKTVWTKPFFAFCGSIFRKPWSELIPVGFHAKIRCRNDHQKILRKRCLPNGFWSRFMVRLNSENHRICNISYDIVIWHDWHKSHLRYHFLKHPFLQLFVESLGVTKRGIYHMYTVYDMISLISYILIEFHL